jgi:hypothetical protein
MKTAMTALAVLMLTQTPALAQERGGRGDHGDRGRWQQQERGGDRGGDDRGGGRRDEGERHQFRGEDDGGRQRQEPQTAPRPAEAPRSAPAPRAPDAPRARNFDGHRDGDGQRIDGRRGYGRADDGQARPPRGDSVGRPGPWTPENRGYRGGDRRPDDNGNRDDRNRGNWDGDRHRDGDRRDGDRRDWDGRRDGRGDDRRWEGHRDQPRWERGRYPSVYSSGHRYRRAWYPPVGFYARAWAFGDFLPNGWYGPRWWIDEPWDFDLPLPPPGYEWVRVGEDALLVDQWSGRVVQVVRGVFYW